MKRAERASLLSTRSIHQEIACALGASCTCPPFQTTPFECYRLIIFVCVIYIYIYNRREGDREISIILYSFNECVGFCWGLDFAFCMVAKVKRKLQE